MPPLLRHALLDSGFVNIEYIGRRDSVTYRNRKYSASDSNTNATDLESLLSYLQKNKILKNKKIILVGHSECGDVNAKVASKQHNNITAMVQLAARTISGNQFLEYQRESIGYFNFLVAFFDQQFFDKTINKYSSLDSYHTADIDGVKQFIRENLLPVEVFMDKYNDMDSIFYHVDMYLHERWQSESEEAKNALENDYNNYFKIFSAFITPQQITFRDIKYENYYPFIKCPVLAVCGTKDENIDCFPNIERMEKLLKDGGNTNFQKIILEDYKHNLAKWNGGGYIVEDSAIQKIVKWIDDQ
jgi:pimeloyl-ACP methyl ester carboxylesterase